MMDLQEQESKLSQLIASLIENISEAQERLSGTINGLKARLAREQAVRLSDGETAVDLSDEIAELEECLRMIGRLAYTGVELPPAPPE